MRSSMTGHLVLTLALAFGAAACDSGDPITPTTPTTPTARVTETFAGSLNVNGAATFTFATGSAGILTATLQAVVPVNTIQLGVALGTWNGVTCQVVLANDKALEGTTVTGSVSGIGSLCVRIYDVGQITQLTAFEVVVVHP